MGSVSIRRLAALVHLTHFRICCSAASDSKARGIGSAYKNLVFIAINPNGPNLPLGSKPIDTSDTLDYDLESDDFSNTDYSGDESSDKDEVKPGGGSGATATCGETGDQKTGPEMEEPSCERHEQVPSTLMCMSLYLEGPLIPRQSTINH